jgi:hypothetical protein
MSGEADLWAAVFALAMKDACETESYACKAAGNSAAPTCRDALEAWAFLTHGGEWGAHREWLAGINGINAGIIREEALRRGPTRGVRVARLNAEMREEKPVVRRKPAKQTKPRAPGRDDARKALCASLASDWAAGVEIEIIAQRTGLTHNAIAKIARQLGARRPADWMARSAVKAASLINAKNAARNAEIMQRHQGGQSIRTICAAMNMKMRTVHSIIYKEKAGSAVEAGGSNSRAAGGGGCSFHGQTMPAERSA